VNISKKDLYKDKSYNPSYKIHIERTPMKCKVHPEEHSVGYCAACGRQVCQACRVSFEGMPHCKSCIEAGNYFPKRASQQPSQEYAQAPYYPDQNEYPPPTVTQEQSLPYPDVQDNPSPWDSTVPVAEPYQDVAAQPLQDLTAQPHQDMTAQHPQAYGAPMLLVADGDMQGKPQSPIPEVSREPHPQPAQQWSIPVRVQGHGALFFKAGAGGALIAGIGSLVCAVFFLISALFFSDYTYSDPTIFAVVSGSILCIGVAFAMMGFYGFHVSFGSRSSVACGGLLLAGGVVFFIIMPFGIKVDSLGRYSMDFTVLYFSELLLGIGLMAGGAGVIAAMYRMAPRDLPVATGTVMIIGGALFCAYIGVYVIGWVVSAISLIMLAMLFISTGNRGYILQAPAWAGESVQPGRQVSARNGNRISFAPQTPSYPSYFPAQVPASYLPVSGSLPAVSVAASNVTNHDRFKPPRAQWKEQPARATDSESPPFLPSKPLPMPVPDVSTTQVEAQAPSAPQTAVSERPVQQIISGAKVEKYPYLQTDFSKPRNSHTTESLIPATVAPVNPARDTNAGVSPEMKPEKYPYLKPEFGENVKPGRDERKKDREDPKERWRRNKKGKS
jgi:hypothetical protein